VSTLVHSWFAVLISLIIHRRKKENKMSPKTKSSTIDYVSLSRRGRTFKSEGNDDDNFIKFLGIAIVVLVAIVGLLVAGVYLPRLLDRAVYGFTVGDTLVIDQGTRGTKDNIGGYSYSTAPSTATCSVPGYAIVKNIDGAFVQVLYTIDGNIESCWITRTSVRKK
jgi:hypothetical protein